MLADSGASPRGSSLIPGTWAQTFPPIPGRGVPRSARGPIASCSIPESLPTLFCRSSAAPLVLLRLFLLMRLVLLVSLFFRPGFVFENVLKAAGHVDAGHLRILHDGCAEVDAVKIGPFKSGVAEF